MIVTGQVGVPDSKIALHVNVHFYTDKVVIRFHCNDDQDNDDNDNANDDGF